ncbi:uncharacterized protein LOC101860444 [Aplysia californica]|uniref:Uncharacterized protein LOC101860444 n=1 Tax=Aplysia californica TaxID=6500 RepID=A0ABM0K3M7_APLCA|nr:uncharacterized protein LOC101860444 [Aplysia californica]
MNPVGTENPHNNKHFIDIYETFRPDYPKEIFYSIYHFMMDVRANFDLAMDVCAGAAKASKPLCTYFKQVIALDSSEDFLSRGPDGVPNLIYQVADCSRPLTFLRSQSVDLVNVASALRFLERRRFYCEVDRVLKPGGCFSLMCVTIPRLTCADGGAYTIIKQKLLKDVFEKHRRRMEQIYSGLDNCDIMYPYYKKFPPIYREMTLTSESCIQMFLTIDVIYDHARDHPDYLDSVRRSFFDWNQGNQLKTFTVTIPSQLVIMHKPWQHRG